MKLIIVILLLITQSVSGQNVWRDEWLRQDKAAHLVGGITMTCAGTELAKDWNFKNPELIGVAFSLTLGMSKEFLYDSRPSPYDLGVNIVGAIAGVYINRWFNKLEKRWYG